MRSHAFMCRLAQRNAATCTVTGHGPDCQREGGAVKWGALCAVTLVCSHACAGCTCGWQVWCRATAARAGVWLMQMLQLKGIMPAWLRPAKACPCQHALLPPPPHTLAGPELCALSSVSPPSNMRQAFYLPARACVILPRTLSALPGQADASR